MIRRLALTIAFFCLSSTLYAQAPVVSPPVTAVRFVVSGGVSPVTNDLPLSAITGPVACVNPPGIVDNPTKFQYKVAATDTTCFQYSDPGNGPLLSLPVGGTSYTSTAAWVNSNGAGPASAVSNPFARPGVAPTTAPAALKVVP